MYGRFKKKKPRLLTGLFNLLCRSLRFERWIEYCGKRSARGLL